MQLDAVEINNYRSLKNLKIKFENLTIFLGPNNAGKSSVIIQILLLLLLLLMNIK